MAADVTLATRQPTIRFPRPQEVEPGSNVALYWNGQLAQNGDGKQTMGPVDLNNPIAGPLPIWLAGHRFTFGGGFGVGGFGEAGALNNPAMGFGGGPFGIGGFGVGGGYWSWSPRNYWRNGEYTIEMHIQDAGGNEQQTPVGTLVVEVLDVPRPSPRAFLEAYDSQSMNLTVGWIASPDFQA